MVGPARKREAVKHVAERLKTSERRACAGLGQPRSTQRYQGRRPSADAGLIKAMRRIARRETRAGYRSVARHLRREGWQANIKRIHRLWKQEGLKLPLQSGDRGAVIDFRHVIKWLVRKPGAFSQYRWREAMFPSLVWRGLYDHLCSRHAGHVADVRYLEILELAANEGLSAVENMVEELLSAPKGVVSAAEVVALLRSYEDEALAFRERQAMPVSLEVYDDLLEGAL